MSGCTCKDIQKKIRDFEETGLTIGYSPAALDEN